MQNVERIFHGHSDIQRGLPVKPSLCSRYP
jgi:hypothetical protein